MPTTSLDTVLTGLDRVRQQGEREWTACCPAHDDREPSLSISLGADGRVLLHCFAGCSVADIARALGLRVADLFEPHAQEHSMSTSTRRTADWAPVAEEFRAAITSAQVDQLAANLGVLPASLRALHIGWATRQRLRDLGAGGSGWAAKFPDGAYAFPERDASGGVIGIAFRAADGRKGAPGQGRRGLVFPVSGRPAGPILVVEGVSDVAACLSVGVAAIGRPSNSGGSNLLADWRDHEQIVIVGENDRDKSGRWPGLDGATSVAGKAGRAWGRRVRVVLPPDGYKDVRAFINARHPLGEGLDDPSRSKATRTELLAWPAADHVTPERAPGELGQAPFPVHALPAPIAAYVVSAADAMSTDPPMLVGHVLAMLGASIGMTRAIIIKENEWNEPPIIWSMVIAPSGTVKSPALGRATRHLEDLDASHQRPPTEDGENGAKARRFVVSDPTIEALAPILRDNPRGVILIRDELSGWFASFDRYAARGGGDVPRWLECFHGRTWRIDRKTGPRAERCIRVPSAAVSIAGTIQFGALRASLGQANVENGLAARFLLAMPHTPAKVWSEARVPKTVDDLVRRIVVRLASLPLPVDAHGLPRPVLVPLDPGAKEAWVDFYNAHAKVTAQEPSLVVRAGLSKLECYAVRLALIFCMTEWAAGSDESAAQVVSEAHMRAGIEVVRWFAQELRRIDARLNETAHEHELRVLDEWARGQGAPVSARDVARRLRAYQGDSARAESMLEALAAQGFGSFDWSEPDQTGGRPAKLYRPHPLGGGAPR